MGIRLTSDMLLVWASASLGLILGPLSPAEAVPPFQVEIHEAAPQPGNTQALDVAVLNANVLVVSRPNPPGLLLDRLASPWPEIRRPNSIVTFTIIGSKGQPLFLSEDDMICRVPELLTPADLIVLKPGEFFGWRMQLGPYTAYSYHLGPGEYRIHAKVCVHFASLVAEDVAFRMFLQSHYGVLDSQQAPTLTEGCSESKSILIRVAAPSGPSGK